VSSSPTAGGHDRTSPDAAARALPALTGAQMREVDRAMVQAFHVELVQMIENARAQLGRRGATTFPTDIHCRARWPWRQRRRPGRRASLSNRGVDVTVILSRPGSQVAPVAAHQLDIVRRLGIVVRDRPTAADLVWTASSATAWRAIPRGHAAELIEWTNEQPAPVLALDAPSGLDVTTGHAGSPCVRASLTMTLALPKVGQLRAPDLVGELLVGELLVADISVPPSLWQRMGVEVGLLFQHEAVIQAERAAT